jgi:hypothetical protein
MRRDAREAREEETYAMLTAEQGLRSGVNRLVYKHLVTPDALALLSPGTLRDFLRPYQQWCAEVGVALDRPLDRPALERLHELLWSDSIDRPEELALALADLGGLAGTWGWAPTVAAAIESRRVGRLEPTENPVELAYREYVQRRAELFDVVAQHATGRRVQRLVEFTPRHDLALEAHRDLSTTKRFESVLARWFEARGRTPFCSVDIEETSTEIQFRVVRGMCRRLQDTIVDGRKLERIEFVPARPDLLVVDRRTGLLAVSAQYAIEHDLYRRVFGHVYFDDEDHFQTHEIYSGDPLLQDVDRALSTEGFPTIASVVLREVRVGSKHGRLRGSLCGEDVAQALAMLLEGELFSQGDVRYLKLAFYWRHRARPTLFEFSPPNRCKFRRLGEDVVREFLLARGFLRMPTVLPHTPDTSTDAFELSDMAAE